jgi:hypothetical protein
LLLAHADPVDVGRAARFWACNVRKQQSDTAAKMFVLNWNDRCENSLMNSRIATISTIPIVITMCIKKMPLDDSFYGFRAERP